MRGVWLLIDEEGLEETQPRAHQGRERGERSAVCFRSLPLLLPGEPARGRQGRALQASPPVCGGARPFSSWKPQT